MIIASWWKFFYLRAIFIQCFHLAGHVQCALLIPSPVQRTNTHMITSDEKIASLFIIQYKGKDAAEHLDTFWSILIIEIENYLTIRFGLPVMCRDVQRHLCLCTV